MKGVMMLMVIMVGLTILVGYIKIKALETSIIRLNYQVNEQKNTIREYKDVVNGKKAA